MAPAETHNLTILLTDIKGFTDKTSRMSRSDMLAMLDRHKEVVLPVLEAKGGRLIKSIGDAFLMVYRSPTDAVLAGIGVQEALREHNKDKTVDDRIEVRVAINCGEVTLTDNDVFGEPVNITARIEGIAEAGEVFFTEAVYLAMNKIEVPSSEVGLLQLKGIPEKVRVYKVRRETPVEGVAAAPCAPASASATLWDKIKLAVPAPAAGLSSSAKAQPVSSGALPPLSRRVGALAIDVLLCSVICIFLFRSGGFLHVMKFPLVWFVYSFLFLKRMGATPGKRILRMRVVQAGGLPMSKKQALWRAAFSVLSGYAFLLGYVWALFEKDRRGWHDLLAGTIVIVEE